MPKQSVIMWMACKRKLLTRDRLKNWGCINNDSCVLCNNGVESIDNLFFQCEYTSRIWSIVRERNDCSASVVNWSDVFQIMVRKGRGGSFCARMKCLTLAAVVYFTWQERNNRIFKDARHSWEYVLVRITENIRDVSWNWRARREYRNWALC